MHVISSETYLQNSSRKIFLKMEYLQVFVMKKWMQLAIHHATLFLVIFLLFYISFKTPTLIQHLYKYSFQQDSSLKKFKYNIQLIFDYFPCNIFHRSNIFKTLFPHNFKICRSISFICLWVQPVNFENILFLFVTGITGACIFFLLFRVYINLFWQM